MGGRRGLGASRLLFSFRLHEDDKKRSRTKMGHHSSGSFCKVALSLGWGASRSPDHTPPRKTLARPCPVQQPRPRDLRNCFAVSARCRLCGDVALPWGWRHPDTLSGPVCAGQVGCPVGRGAQGHPRPRLADGSLCRPGASCSHSRTLGPGPVCLCPARLPSPVSVSPAVPLCRCPATQDALLQ